MGRIKYWAYCICIGLNAIILIKTALKVPEQLIYNPLFGVLLFMNTVGLIELLPYLKKKPSPTQSPTRLEIGNGTEDVYPQLDDPIKRIEG
jgi:hypothetical protein